MAATPDFAKIAARAQANDRYKKQLARVVSQGHQVDCIEQAVDGVITKLPRSPSGSLVVYGDPQSGKTEMMICLTARLLDEGQKTVVHLMNDSVDLLTQSLDRFTRAGLAPAPRSVADLAASPLVRGYEAVVFCKKNAKDLRKLLQAVEHSGPVVVVDDEADYATPNAKINASTTTRINNLISTLLGRNGRYIGVTATPARLNLNNTFQNRSETWVWSRRHRAYSGQDVFFPQSGSFPYRLQLLPGPASSADVQAALRRFMVTVAYLNGQPGTEEKNFTFLIHTSGRKDDHAADRRVVDQVVSDLIGGGQKAARASQAVYQVATQLYPTVDPVALSEYVAANASRTAVVVLNSNRKGVASDKPTNPTSPFTVIIGGNIVSRGVTFPDLLAMFFSRDVKTKLQQDTYIQRARMFGARSANLSHFELTIPSQLYWDWHRCFVFHRLALEAIEKSSRSPVWLSDPRIAVVASSSIDRSTVDFDKGEMSFQLFDLIDHAPLDAIVAKDPLAVSTLRALAERIGPALPSYLVEYIEMAQTAAPGTLAIHDCLSIGRYGSSADVDAISRSKGFIGKPQLEAARFPKATHHIRVLYNGKGRARVFYKNLGGVQFIQNQRA